MLVTCYYDIYNNLEKFNVYIELFRILGNSGIPMILFTNPNLVSQFVFPSVTVIGISLEDFELYSIVLHSNKDLPTNRNMIKDTKEFFALMNTKIEFIKKAAEIVDNNTFVWVDFGILKIINNSDEFINKLKNIDKNTYTNITIPGCWNFGIPFSYDNVNWRFCGTLFIIPRHHIDTFYNHCKNVLIESPKITWEVNIWNIVEQYMVTDITWYLADHNDSIINL